MSRKKNNHVKGMAAIAGVINQKLGDNLGLTADKTTISRWRASKFIPKGLRPFPAPTANGAYNVPECLEWAKEFIKARAKNPETPQMLEAKAEAAARRERARANREERNDQKEAGLLIERAVAERDAIGIIQRLHNSCTTEHEQEIPTFCIEQLKSIGVSVENISLFIARLTEKMQGITARRVANFQKATEEVLKDA